MPEILQRLRDIVGARNVLADADARRPFETDVTGTLIGRSRAVVRPGSTSEVSEVLRLAHATRTPVVPQGGNTGLAGGCFAGDAGEAILLSLGRMNRIREIRAPARLAIAEAGVVLQALHAATAEHGLSYPVTFGAKGSATIGGTLSTNAGGSNVLRHGNSRDRVLGIEAVLPTGEIVDLMTELHKDNSGYSLRHLLIGAEGTLGVITAAVLKLAPLPKAYFTAMVSVPRLADSLELLNSLQEETGQGVEAFEYMPAPYFELLRRRFPESRLPFDPPAEHGIFLEVGLSRSDDVSRGPDGALAGVARLEALLARALERGGILDAVICRSEAQRQAFWENRERAFEATVARGMPVNNDIALPLDKVETFLTMMETRLPAISPRAEAVTVAHLGDGNLHYSVWPDPESGRPVAPEDYERVLEVVEEAVRELGGSFSAEHGIGVLKLGSMHRRKDKAALAAMRAIKAALDPAGILNPGKVLPPE